MHDETHDLVPLLYHFNLGFGRSGHRKSQPPALVTTPHQLRGSLRAQRFGGGIPFSFEERFQWVLVGVGVIGTGLSTNLLFLNRFLAVSVRLRVRRSVDSEVTLSPSGGLVSP